MLKGLYYVEFLTDNVARTQRYFEGYGLRVAAETTSGSFGVWLKADTATPLSIVVREAGSKMERAKLNRSGTCVTDIAFLVDNVDSLLKNVGLASKEVLDMNVSSQVGLKSDFRFVQLYFPRPGLRHTLLECDDFDFLPEGWTTAVSEASSVDHDSGSRGSQVPLVSFIDHIAIACLGGTLPSILRWYEIAFQLRQKTGVITIKTDLGDGLRLGSLYHTVESMNETFVKLTFVESVKVPGVKVANQVTTFLKNHGGPGVQHLAFLAPDIFRARRKLAAQDVEFLAAPPGYYELPRMVAQAKAAGIELSKLAAGGILFDNEPENMQLDDPDADSNYLLQVFTRSPFPRDTCFFELITRGNHREGFGTGNIRNLFLAVALEKKRKAREARRFRAAAAAAAAAADTMMSADGYDGTETAVESEMLSAVPSSADLLPDLMDESAYADVHACTTPTVIIGATLVGLSMGLSLARAGVKTVIIGKEPSKAQEASFHLMGPRSMDFWRRLGIASSVAEIVTPLSTLEVWNGVDGSHKDQKQDCMYLPTASLRALLLKELALLPDLCQVRLGHDVVALGEVDDRMAVHVEPPGPLLAEYVLCAEGRNSFWSSHLLAGNHLDFDDMVSVNLASPSPTLPAVRNMQVWLNPWVDSDSMVAVPMGDGTVQVVFPASESLQDMELKDEDEDENDMGDDELFLDDDQSLDSTSFMTTTEEPSALERRVCSRHAVRIANFCSLLGLDKHLGLESEMQQLAELQMQSEEIAACAKKELAHCKQSELLVVGLDAATEAIEDRQRRLARWWSPAVTIPNSALRAVNRTVVRRKGQAEELGKKYLAAVKKLEEEMTEVEQKMNEIRRGIVKRKASLINSVEELKLKGATYLSRAVSGRMIYFPNNNCVNSVLNVKANEALADVAALAWRMAAVVNESESREILLQYEEERMLAAQVRLHQKQYLLRFFTPGAMQALRDAVQDVGVEGFSLDEFLRPASLSADSSTIRDWASSLTPASRDYFVDGPVMCAGFETTLSACLPSWSFSLLCFGVAPPTSLDRSIASIVIRSGPDAPDIDIVDRASVLVVEAIKANNVWEHYQAGNGTMVLLRPDWIVQARCTQGSEAFGTLMSESRFRSTAALAQLPPKVAVWNSLSFQKSIYWLLYDAMQALSDDRVKLLQRILSQLGRVGHSAMAEVASSTSNASRTSSSEEVTPEEIALSRALVSRCISQNIEIFELEDIVNKAVEALKTLRSRKTSARGPGRKTSIQSSGVNL